MWQKQPEKMEKYPEENDGVIVIKTPKKRKNSRRTGSVHSLHSITEESELPFDPDMDLSDNDNDFDFSRRSNATSSARLFKRK